MGGRNLSLDEHQTALLDQSAGSDGAVAGIWRVCYCTSFDSYDYAKVKCDRPREFISDAGLLYIRGLVGAIRVTARVHVDLPPEMRATMFLELTAHLFQAAVEDALQAQAVGIALSWVGPSPATLCVLTRYEGGGDQFHTFCVELHTFFTEVVPWTFFRPALRERVERVKKTHGTRWTPSPRPATGARTASPSPGR